MKIRTIKFYFISHSHDTMEIPEQMLDSRARPILWNNQGLFCIISRQKVQNVIDLAQDSKNLPVLNQKEMGVFHWGDGELIDAKIASRLLS